MHVTDVVKVFQLSPDAFPEEPVREIPIASSETLSAQAAVVYAVMGSYGIPTPPTLAPAALRSVIGREETVILGINLAAESDDGAESLL